jgi:hypothetical protein
MFLELSFAECNRAAYVYVIAEKYVGLLECEGRRSCGKSTLYAVLRGFAASLGFTGPEVKE